MSNGLVVVGSVVYPSDALLCCDVLGAILVSMSLVSWVGSISYYVLKMYQTFTLRINDKLKTVKVFKTHKK